LLGLGVRVDDLTGEVAELNRQIGAWARGRHPDRRAEILALTDQLADVAGEAGQAAAGVLETATVALADPGPVPRHARRLLGRLRQAHEALPGLVAQAKARAEHQAVPAADKRLSIRDRDARPIKKATTPRKQIQFGYTAQIAEDAAGLIVDHEVFIGQPADAELLPPAIKRIAGQCGIPATVTADKTYGTTISRQALTDLGVTTVAVAYKANQKPPPPTTPEAARHFNAAVRWRAGVEARISTLKRDHGWDRTRMVNLTGARTWLGFGVFAHNTRKLARLT
jgi:transposase, IS5 family